MKNAPARVMQLVDARNLLAGDLVIHDGNFENDKVIDSVNVPDQDVSDEDNVVVVYYRTPEGVSGLDVDTFKGNDKVTIVPR